MGKLKPAAMNTDKKIYRVVGGIIRQRDQLLLVRQQGPNDPTSSWGLPGGVVEIGELLTEALAREVREEMGLCVLDPGQLAYVVQFDNPLLQQLHQGAGPGNGYFSTTHIFEVSHWDGKIHAADPDGFVLEAHFLPLSDAIGKLEQVPLRVMREPIVAYLRGEVSAGAMWFYRRPRDGSDMLIARLENRRSK